MKKLSKIILLISCLLVCSAGCSPSCTQVYPDSTEDKYVNISLDKDSPFYANYNVVCARKDQHRDAKKLLTMLKALCVPYFVEPIMDVLGWLMEMISANQI